MSKLNPNNETEAARRGKMLTTSSVLSVHKIQFYVCFVLNNFAAIFQANLSATNKKKRRARSEFVLLFCSVEMLKQAARKQKRKFRIIIYLSLLCESKKKLLAERVK